MMKTVKIYKLRVVLEIDGDCAFCDWFTIAENAVSAIDSIKKLVRSAFPSAFHDAYVHVEVISESTEEIAVAA